MPTAREIALSVLPHFAESVIAKRIHSYGAYATWIGRNPAKESMIIGQAMHAIGASCVLAAIPVAPLHFVKRADGEWRGVFEQDVTESIHVLPHYDLLCVSARVLVYTPEHFTKVDKVLRELIPKHFPEDYRSPHDLWHFAVHSKLKDGSTFFSRALKRYETIVQDARRARHAKPDRA